MKILVVGSDKVYAIENIYVNHLRELGADVSHFAAQSRFYDYYQHSMLNKIIFKAGLSGILKKVNHSLKEEIAVFRPDFVWLFKGMEIFPDTLKWIKARKIKLINYNPDNPFLFTNKGSGNKNITESIGLYDLHFTYNLMVKKELEEKYKLPVAYLPFGYELSDELYHTFEKEEETGKACFLGNPDTERAAFILELASKGIEIDVYGNDWKKYADAAGITAHAAVYKESFWKVLRRYRVQLNLMRIHNPVSHNMRSFEIPAIGGIALMPDTPEHRLFFDDKKEAFFFTDSSSCAAAIQEILAMSKEKSLEIRKQARSRCVRSGYSYRDRAAFAWDTMKKLYA